MFSALNVSGIMQDERGMQKKMKNKIQKHPEGRPTKYIPKVIFPKVKKYILNCSKEQTELPSVEGLALALDVDTDTINEWTKIYPEFSVTIKKLAYRQKKQLMDDGLYGGKEVNAAMAIFLLKVNHGMKENDPSTLVQVNVQPILGELKAQ